MNGKESWGLRFPRTTLPGTYSAYAYALDRAGNRQAGFVRGKNLAVVRIPPPRR
jgi:hypothetical protein